MTQLSPADRGADANHPIYSEASGHRPSTVAYKPGRNYDVPRIVLDIDRAKRAFGWAPQIGLDQGLRATWDWILGLQATVRHKERPKLHAYG